MEIAGLSVGNKGLAHGLLEQYISLTGKDIQEDVCLDWIDWLMDLHSLLSNRPDVDSSSA